MVNYMKVKLYNGKKEELWVINKKGYDSLMKLSKDDLIFIIDAEIIQRKLSEKIAEMMD